MFVVPAMPVSDECTITKRNVLKKIATVFDPLGLASPFITQAKTMLQERWTRGYDWGDQVQDQVVSRIQAWFAQLEWLEKIKVPRCLKNQQPVKSKEVVIFVDAFHPMEMHHISGTSMMMGLSAVT